MQVSRFIFWSESLYSSQQNEAKTQGSWPTSARGRRVNARYQLKYRATTRCRLTKHLQMLNSLCTSYATATPRAPGNNMYSLLQEHSEGSFQGCPYEGGTFRRPTFSSPSITSSIPQSFILYGSTAASTQCARAMPCPDSEKMVRLLLHKSCPDTDHKKGCRLQQC